jgi:hypothetical protein
MEHYHRDGIYEGPAGLRREHGVVRAAYKEHARLCSGFAVKIVQELPRGH